MKTPLQRLADLCRAKHGPSELGEPDAALLLAADVVLSYVEDFDKVQPGGKREGQVIQQLHCALLEYRLAAADWEKANAD